MGTHPRVHRESYPMNTNMTRQCLSQDLEIGWPKLVFAEYFGVLFFKGDHNIFRLQSSINMYLLREISI